MKIQVKILPFMVGPAEQHRVVLTADIHNDDGSAGRALRAEALRLDEKGGERPMNLCLEEAFADILRQALSA